MKLPNILQQALQMFGTNGGGILAQDKEFGIPAVYCWVPLSREVVIRSPAIITRPTLHRYDSEGPIIRILVAILDRPTNRYNMEIFMDPAEGSHRETLRCLADTTCVNFHVFGSGALMPHLVTKQFDWTSVQCLAAERALLETEGQRTNFTAAKCRYIRENPFIWF